MGHNYRRINICVNENFIKNRKKQNRFTANERTECIWVPVIVPYCTWERVGVALRCRRCLSVDN